MKFQLKLPHNNRFKTLLNGIDFFSYKTKIILWVKNYVQQKKKIQLKSILLTSIMMQEKLVVENYYHVVYHY